MKVKFTDKYYNKSMAGKTKELPDHLAKELIKLKVAEEVKTRQAKQESQKK